MVRIVCVFDGSCCDSVVRLLYMQLVRAHFVFQTVTKEVIARPGTRAVISCEVVVLVAWVQPPKKRGLWLAFSGVLLMVWARYSLFVALKPVFLESPNCCMGLVAGVDLACPCTVSSKEPVRGAEDQHPPKASYRTSLGLQTLNP